MESSASDAAQSVRSRPARRALDADLAMFGVVALNLVGALVLAERSGQWVIGLSVGLACLGLAALGTFLFRGTLGARLLVVTALTALVALQIHLTRGTIEYHFNVFISMSLLLIYRDWRPIAAMAGLFALHHVAFDRMLAAGLGTYCLGEPDLWRVALHAFFVVVQCVLLMRVAHSQRRERDEARELELLVKAMGLNGPIRLNLDVMRAVTPAGQRLRQVQRRMADAMREVREAGERIDAAARDVAQGNQDLLSRTEATASGLRDSAMCLEQIGIIVDHSNETSGEARALSETVSAVAERGGRMVSDVTRNMEDIQTASRRIADITGVIDGIAFQTNILALNAAVEAARAGEQGRGFAVVAGEVRNLAQRSAGAAREIKELVGSSTLTIEQGTQLVAGAGQTMSELVDAVRRVGTLFETITADTTDHREGLKSVSSSMDELGRLTGQNVDLSERTGQSVQDMQAQVERLGEVLAAFKIGDAQVRVPLRPNAAKAAPQPASSAAPGTAPAAPSIAPRPAVAAASGPASVEFF